MRGLRLGFVEGIELAQLRRRGLYPEAMDDVVFAEVAAVRWGRPLRVVRRLAGGMNGITLELDDAGERRVLKWVPESDRSSLVRGARAAEQVAAQGVRAGAPIASMTGDLTVSALEGELMLMEFVAGEELTRAEDDQRAMAGLLTSSTHAPNANRPRTSSMRRGCVTPLTSRLRAG